jgi:DMSO/TMAO reductase YedYZ molybdopterin-dependent catalytic subunit
VRFDPRLPAPPSFLRRGPFREGAFRSRLRGERAAVRAGIPLATAFTVCFVTGLISHVEQHPPSWLDLPSRPIWGYRLTQGVHVASGLIAIPLLLVKLWTVYPRLFQWPPARSVLHALERLSVGVLAACGLFELFTGLLNTLQWYPWPFPFIQTHYWVAWILVGALTLHIAVKAPQLKQYWYRMPSPLRRHAAAARAGGETAEPAEPGTVAAPAGAGNSGSAAAAGARASAEAVGAGGAGAEPPAAPASAGGLTRRGLVAATATAVGVVTITTVGQSFTPLRYTNLLAPRSPDGNPQGLPLNRTARAAGVTTTKTDAWALQVIGPRPYRLTLDELVAMPQYDAVLPIACVEGWSKDAHWSGVRMRDLLDRAGAPGNATVTVSSLDRGAYGRSTLDPNPARDPLTLLALRLNGEVLSLDHGYPARLIAPFRPGVLQTKWVTTIRVLPPGQA